MKSVLSICAALTVLLFAVHGNHANAYNFRFKQRAATKLQVHNGKCGVAVAVSAKDHCGKTPPDMPETTCRVCNADTNGCAKQIGDKKLCARGNGIMSRKSKRTRTLSREDQIKTVQPDKRDKCLNLQDESKCGGADASADAAVDALLEDAKIYKPLFDNLMKKMAQNSGVDADSMTVVAVKNKKKARCVEKINQKYGCPGRYGARELTDIVRGSIEFEDEAAMCAFMNAVLVTTDGVIDAKYLPEGIKKASIRNSKNRFKRDAEGMRDYLINIKITTSDTDKGHVTELQLHHRNQVDAKHIFHCVYSYVRRITEAIKLTSKDPAKVFCDEDACAEYHIDTKHNGESSLDKMYKKWVVDGTENGKGQKVKHPELWEEFVKPYLQNKDATQDFKIARTAATKVNDMVELEMFIRLASKMEYDYDQATFGKLKGGYGPMYQDEIHDDETGDQKCPTPPKQCKCTQAIELAVESS